jgi:DNA-binding transcriptional LysR family regulator
VLSLVAAGLGVAIVNDANADRPPAGVSFLPFSDYSVPLILHFTYRSDNDNPVLCAFLRTVRAYATAAPRPEIDARRVRTDAEE